jgi:hypothetical protein
MRLQSVAIQRKCILCRAGKWTRFRRNLTRLKGASGLLVSFEYSTDFENKYHKPFRFANLLIIPHLTEKDYRVLTRNLEETTETWNLQWKSFCDVGSAHLFPRMRNTSR